MANRQLSRRAREYLLPVRDEEGRPLGERHATPAVRDAVPMETVPCPYPGSRNDHANPMNVSALQQMRRHWTAVSQSFDDLRSLCDARTQRASVAPMDIWRLAKLGECLPQFLVLRRDHPIASGELPAAIGALYKVSLGLRYALHWQIERSALSVSGDARIEAGARLEPSSITSRRSAGLSARSRCARGRPP